MPLTLSLLPGTLAIGRLSADAPLPSWATGRFLSITRTPDELSIVCDAALIPPGVSAEGGWACLKVAGPLDFALTGILAALATTLADAGIPLFALSTYETDYLLIKQARLTEALAALRAAGHSIDGA